MPDSTPLFLRQLQYSTPFICPCFFGPIYFHFVTLNSQILLECSDISIELTWVLIMYVVVMTYIWIGRSWIFLYNLGIVVLHVFISFLGGVLLCIPYGLYSGT